MEEQTELIVSLKKQITYRADKIAEQLQTIKKLKKEKADLTYRLGCLERQLGKHVEYGADKFRDGAF